LLGLGVGEVVAQDGDLGGNVEPREVGDLGDGGCLGLEGGARHRGDGSIDFSDVEWAEVSGVARLVWVAESAAGGLDD